MDKDILQLIGITDPEVSVEDEYFQDGIHYIVLVKQYKPHYCPECSCRMESKGFYTRTVKHSVLQGIGSLVLKFKERKWHCKNCGYYENDSVNFIEPYKHTTSLMPYMIINDMKDIHVTAATVARKYNVSNTYVHETFMRYVDLPRLPLSDTISIAEVYLNFNRYNRYAMVIMDFRTNQIIDILPNRNNDTTHTYFMSIPKEERDKVRYVISDMYNPYLNFSPAPFSTIQ